ncbi:MAG: hypothetical protein QOH81_3330 [Sphingomonadales bacterium]|jgi:hypothetical protein|nr:hypothetical protein [Sphingomonadales bacterium]
MLGIIEWTLFLYLALKVCHFLFGPLARRTDAPLWTKLRSGEPMLMIGVFGSSALLTIYGMWFSHTNAERWYAYSTGCYAKLAAAHQLPLLMRAKNFGAYDAAMITSNYFDSAEIHGLKLGIRLEVIKKKLNYDGLSYSGYYGRITAKNDRRAIAASFADLHRCLKHVGAPRGEFLSP